MLNIAEDGVKGKPQSLEGSSCILWTKQCAATGLLGFLGSSAVWDEGFSATRQGLGFRGVRFKSLYDE